ncbi:Magnesium transporter NIPA2 [Purpureocillium lavendulum]|uniref:Magnesium transporter NIPA2 n=1 Tax=Purpureocillium lavendulum TaxID=1247861 RepID=A0AB34FVN0_9HYPO|nr:Magnesium transporter NIPA2 [Purpureocillium lavendulum]
MASKEVVFITGANQGIGFETVKALFSSGKAYHVFLGSRSLSNADDAIAELKKLAPDTKSTVEPVQIDVTDDESINAAAQLVESKVGKVDVLINNAGSYPHTLWPCNSDEASNTITGAAFDTEFTADSSNFRDVFNKAWDVNVSGTQVATTVFAPLLLRSSSPRLIFLTSGLSTLTGASKSFMPPWAPKPSSGWPKTGLIGHQGYKAAKAGLNMLMLTWHWILHDDGVKTWCISPGFLATNLGGRGAEVLRAAGAGEPSKGGELIRKVVEGERDADVGKVVTQDGVQPW